MQDSEGEEGESGKADKRSQSVVWAFPTYLSPSLLATKARERKEGGRKKKKKEKMGSLPNVDQATKAGERKKWRLIALKI